MAKVVEIAGGIVSFVALAGHVAQGLNSLSILFKDIKNSPGDVATLATKLRIV
jgi:hypothetical protein